MLTTSDIFFLPILAFVIRRPRCVGGSMPRLNGMAVKQASEYVLIYITHENAICYKKIEKFFKKVAITLCGSGNPKRNGVCFSGKCRAAFRDFAHALQNFVSPNSAAAWQNAEISMRFPRIYASLAEFSTSTAEISKRLVNFCSPKACFLDIVSAENAFGRGVSFCFG